MKTTVSFYDFRDAFNAHDRLGQFSREGLRVLFEYLTEYEDSTGEEIELDVIALCCDYYEDSWESIAEEYRIDLSACDDEEDKMECVLDYLEYRTVIVGEPYEGVFIYGAF